MMQPVSLFFDNHELSELFTVERHVIRRLPTWEPNLVDVPGMSGAIYAGTRALPTTVEMDLYFLSEDRHQRQVDIRTLASYLAVDEPKALVLGDEGGLWRKAVPQLEQPITAYLNADAVHLTFICPDPWLYGLTRTCPLSASTIVRVGGTAPTLIDIEVTSATSGTLAIANTTTGETMSIGTVQSGANIKALSTEHRLIVNGTEKVLPVLSDWLTAQPGSNELTLTGGGSSVVAKFVERWW